MRNISRRNFLIKASTAIGLPAALSFWKCTDRTPQPNLVFVFADQWRACDSGYAGNKEVRTPHLDKLASESINFTNAVSGCPVCSPYRASLMTGQYWLTHGVFYNDKPLGSKSVSIAQVYKNGGYRTAYIGKWHLNGKKKNPSIQETRNEPVPRENRLGFDFWRVHDCTHNYTHSVYFDEDNKEHLWPGYDAIAQTKLAQTYIRKRAAQESPFVLFLSWGPPHSPYHTAPEKYRDLFPEPAQLTVRPNVPDKLKAKARWDYSGYYAHMAALDDCLGNLLQTIRESGIEENTIFVFTSDHGDMLYSQGMTKKQKPWDESLRVPFLLRYPAIHGKKGRKIDMPLNTPDIMPTLLGLSNLPIPDTVEGSDYSGFVRNEGGTEKEAALIMCPVPFHQWNYKHGGREYRGVRTRRYTYVRDLKGPWLLYDNLNDPFQMKNLVNQPEFGDLQQNLELLLLEKLKETNDQFLPGPEYMKKWGYSWDGNDGPKNS